MGEKGLSTAVRFDAGLPSIQTINTTIKQGENLTKVNYKLLTLPLYLVERMPALISSF